MRSIDTSVQGKRWGVLVAQYRTGRRIACRCRCQRLVFFAAEALADGAATSCGCSSPSSSWIAQQRRLAAEMRRTIDFRIACSK
jgi:hypothetical protein